MKTILYFCILLGTLFVGGALGFLYGNFVGMVAGIILAPLVLLFLIDDSHENPRRHTR